MANETVIENVSDTALWVAVYRAQESIRPDAVFKDPLAAVLAGERGRKIAENAPGSRYTAWTLVTRTSIIDRFIVEHCQKGIDTVLNLGAGLDSRPYRLDLPHGLCWIEADFPSMINYKKDRLRKESPRCHLVREALDLSDRAQRQALLHKVNSESKGVLVLAEGLLIYLSNQNVGDLADELRRCVNFKYWIHDWYSESTLKIVRSKNATIMKSAPIIFDPPEGWFPFIEKRGWKLQNSVSLAEEGDRINRNQMLPWIVRMLTKVVPGSQARMNAAGGCAIFQRT